MNCFKQAALLAPYFALTAGAVASLASSVNAAEKPLVWQTLNEPGCGGAMTAISVSPFDSKRVLVAGDMLGVGLSTDGGDHWQATTGFRSWEIADFTWHPTDPQTVWVGTMSGPYVSHDGGRTWQEKRNGFPQPAPSQYSAPVQKVLYDPADTNHLLAFGGSSRFWSSPGKPLWGVIWESRDGGEKWRRLTVITPNGSSADGEAEGRNVTCVLYAPGAAGRSGVLYAAAVDAGFVTSIDNGKTWKRHVTGLPAGAKYSRFAVHPMDPNTLWMAVGNYKANAGDTAWTPGGVWMTRDGGKTWAESSRGLGKVVIGSDTNTTSRYEGISVSRTNPAVLYTNDTAYSTGVIYKSENGGADWHPVASKQNVGHSAGASVQRSIFQVMTGYPAGLGMGVLTVDAKNANTVYAVNSEFIVRTRDGGKTWDDATACATPGGENAWSGRGYSGLCSQNFRFSPIKPGDALLLGMDAGKLWRSRDDLKTWTFHGSNPWPWGGGNDAVYAGKAIYATFGQFGQYLGIGRTLDDGKTWATLGGASHGLPEVNSNGGVPLGIYARSDIPSDVWTTINGALYHSADAGEKWEKTALDGWKGWIAGDPKNPAHFYVTSDKSVYESINGGASFTPIGGPRSAGRITVDAMGRVYVAAHRQERGGLWRYEKGTWTRLLDDPFVANVAVDPADPNRLAVTTCDDPYHDYSGASGVWLSADAGKTWRQANDGLAMTRGYAIAFDPWTPGRLVFGSFGRGYFVTTWPKNYVPSTAPKSYAVTAEDVQFAGAGEPTTPASKPARALIGSLKNGDMSAGGETPTDWGIAWTGRGRLTIARDTKVFRNGPASLRLDTGAADAMGQATQSVDAPGGTRFALSGAVKSEGEVKVNVAIQSFTAGWKTIEFKQMKYAENDSDWANFASEMTVPANTAHAAVTLLIEGNGKAWLDDVKLTVNGRPVNAASSPVLDRVENPLVPSPGYWPDYPTAWNNVHNGFVETAHRDASKIRVVFLGDSITQGWDKTLWKTHFEPVGAVNFGIGGDGVQQLQWRVGHGELDPLKPKLIVLMIGINNFWGKKGTDDEIVEGTTNLVRTLREKQPQSRILLLGILPAIESPTDGTRTRIKRINTRYAKLADGKSVRFLDIGPAFLEPDGRISRKVMGDYLHPTAAGYQRYVKALLPTFDEMQK